MRVMTVETSNVCRSSGCSSSCVGPCLAQIPPALIVDCISVGRICLCLGILGSYVSAAVLAPGSGASGRIFSVHAVAIPRVLNRRLAVAEWSYSLVAFAVATQAVAVDLLYLRPRTVCRVLNGRRP